MKGLFYLSKGKRWILKTMNNNHPDPLQTSQPTLELSCAGTGNLICTGPAHGIFSVDFQRWQGYRWDCLLKETMTMALDWENMKSICPDLKKYIQIRSGQKSIGHSLGSLFASHLGKTGYRLLLPCQPHPLLTYLRCWPLASVKPGGRL